jgi:hypothetical protein
MIIGTIINGVVIDHIPAGADGTVPLSPAGRTGERGRPHQERIQQKAWQKGHHQVNENIDLDFDILATSTRHHRQHIMHAANGQKATSPLPETITV